MGVDYEKCDNCNQIFSDCGDNYPIRITLTNGKHLRVCPECLQNYCLLPSINIDNDEDFRGFVTKINGKYEYWDSLNSEVTEMLSSYPKETKIEIIYIVNVKKTKTFNRIFKDFLKSDLGDELFTFIKTKYDDLYLNTNIGSFFMELSNLLIYIYEDDDYYYTFKFFDPTLTRITRIENLESKLLKLEEELSEERNDNTLTQVYKSLDYYDVPEAMILEIFKCYDHYTSKLFKTKSKFTEELITRMKKRKAT